MRNTSGILQYVSTAGDNKNSAHEFSMTDSCLFKNSTLNSKNTCKIMKTRYKCKIEHALVFQSKTNTSHRFGRFQSENIIITKLSHRKKSHFFPLNLPKSICSWQTQHKIEHILQYNDLNLGGRMSFSAFASFF